MDLQRLGSSEEDLSEIVAFMARLNREASHHVFYCDEDETALRQSLSEFAIPPEQTFVVARENGVIQGVLGFDADTRLGRAWAYGPFVDHAEHSQVAEFLWRVSVPLLPQEVVQLELAFDVRNKGLERFAESHGMTLYTDMLVLALRNDEWARLTLGKHEIGDLAPHHREAFGKLHETSFPATFWTTQEIIDRLDERRRVLIAENNGEVIGYIYAEVDTPTRQGGIEFLAVEPDRRRSGVGNALVEESLRWLFSVPDVDEVFVIVDDENPAGRLLFEGFGFRVIRRMMAFRMPRPLP